MRIEPVLSLLAAAAMVTAPSTSAVADPRSPTSTAAARPADAPAPPAAASDAERYAAREATSAPAVLDFEGGSRVVLISTGTLTLVLLILLVVILV